MVIAQAGGELPLLGQRYLILNIDSSKVRFRTVVAADRRVSACIANRIRHRHVIDAGGAKSEAPVLLVAEFHPGE